MLMLMLMLLLQSLVSDGKMFAELERARLTKILANMEEKDGKVNEAAELLQEVQVSNENVTRECD